MTASEPSQCPPGPAITASGLARLYGNDVWALQDASFEAGYGTVFALLGRNGSGKTTTVRILTTLSNATSGSARVAGFDVTSDAPAVRHSIGVTMQSAALDPEMTGREHLELICGAWGDRRSRARDHAAELLSDFGLTEAAGRLIATYSGGMKRRLDVAGALANSPQVLFLDEPTTGLDAQSRRALWERVRALRLDGAAVFLTTQYLEEADQLADIVAVLDGGRIIAQGTPKDLKARHSATTVRIRSSHPGPIAASISVLAPVASAITIEHDGWVRADLASAAAALDLIRQLRLDGAGLTDISIVPASLEDAYLALTGEAVERNAGDLAGSQT